eukprot:Skav216256  [mRNA]  locus=scaffold20:311677:317156:- [translate_table: standard]
MAALPGALPGAATRVATRFGRAAMPPDFSLEPCRADVQAGDVLDVVGLAVVFDPAAKRLLLRSSIHGYFFTVQCDQMLPEARAYTLLGATVLVANPRIHLKVDFDNVLSHRQPISADFDKATETCAGMGFLGQGLRHAQMQVVAHNDLRKPYCEWKEKNGECPVVHGDIGDVQTIKELFKVKGSGTMLTAGFSCQPWSRLGDGKGVADERASCLTKVLQASHLLQSHSLLLECVIAAGKDAWVKRTLTQYCRQTGYQMQELEQHLNNVLPAQRSRWWCLLRAPVIPHSPVAPLPALTPPPVIHDLLPGVLRWSADEEKQLSLDHFESRMFHRFGGIGSNLINGQKPLKTALHGWGNQLTRCPCSCRDFPLSDSRLESKGIFAALYLLDGEFDIGQTAIPKTRHIHPWELAVLHGIRPDQCWEPLRLTLSGMGQMAAPVQACWIASFYMEDASFFMGTKAPTPEENVWNLFDDLFRGMALSHPESVMVERVGRFFTRITDLLNVSRVARYPLMQFCPLLDLGSHSLPEQSRASVPSAVTSLEIQETSVDATAPRETIGCHRDDHMPPQKKRRVDDFPHVMGGMTAFAAQVSDVAAAEDTEPSFTQVAKDLFHRHPNLGEGARDDATAGTMPSDHDPVLPVVANGHSHTLHIAPTREDDSNTAHNEASSPEHHEPDHEQNGTTRDPQSPEALSPEDSHVEDTGNAEVISTPPVVTESKGGSTSGPVEMPVVAASTPPVTTDSKGGRTVAHAPEPVDSTDHPTTAIEAEVTHSTPPVTTDSKGGSEGTNDDAPSAPADGMHTVILIKPESTFPHSIRIHRDATVGSITVAEEKLRTMTNPMRAVDLIGRPLALGDVTHDQQLIQIGQMEAEVLINHIPARLNFHGPLPRDHVLFLQQQWVANDEFDYYLSILQNTGHTSTVPSHVASLEVEDSELKAGLQEWMTRCMYGAVSNRQTASAMVVQGHWMPILVTQHALGIRIRTTPEAKNWVLAAIPNDSSIHVVEHPLPVGFPDDCGFQSVAWLANQVLETHQGTPSFTIPLGPHNAIAWRSMFLHQLYQQPISMVEPHQLAFGGMGQTDVTDTLKNLLQEHGVPVEEVAKRAEAVLTSLGRAATVAALRGPKPWKDLKQLANQASPRFQLVLAHELSAVIQARAPGKSFGDKRQKAKPPAAPPVMLTPQDVVIPDGVFKDNEGNMISQISVRDIRPDATGIALVTMQEALPYIKKSITVSTKALALIIIDPQELVTQMVGKSLRIPARCIHTQEPVLLTGRVVQIGTGVVDRHMPLNTLKVEEVPNSVEIIRILPELGGKGTEDLLDCWDRQYLSLQMQKCKPGEAEQFIVTFRIQTNDICAILALSGRQGIYLEPREADGRRPCARFRVVWLSKLSKAEAMISMNSTTKWVCLVRTAKRFGLRVKLSDAPHVHSQHKDTPYLDTVDAQIFVGGPFPWGATRATLNKLFAQWQWPARPLQPKGRSIDGKGLMWEIQAAKAPQYEIYTLEHADILIAAAPTNSKRQPRITQEIQGSAKTLAALKTQSASSSGQDPLQLNDPWMSKQPRVHAPPGLAEPSRVDVAMAQVEHRVSQQIKQQVQTQIDSLRQEDKEMTDDGRINELEARVQHMEQVITEHHQAQHRHNQEVQGQMQQLNQKVDTQTANLQQHLDSRLTEQLQHIERLLTKSKE